MTNAKRGLSTEQRAELGSGGRRGSRSATLGVHSASHRGPCTDSWLIRRAEVIDIEADVTLQAIGPSQFGAPVISSPAVNIEGMTFPSSCLRSDSVPARRVRGAR